MHKLATPPYDMRSLPLDALPSCIHCGDEIIHNLDGLGTGWYHTHDEMKRCEA